MMRPPILGAAEEAIVRNKWDVRVVASAMETKRKNVLHESQAREA